MFCQKCRQPLKLDASLQDLNPAAYDLLVSSSALSTSKHSPTKKSSKKSQAKDSGGSPRQSLYDAASQSASVQPTFKRHHGAHPRDPAMSFIYLSESLLGQQHDRSQSCKKQQNQQSALISSSSRPAAAAAAAAAGPNSALHDEMGRISRLFEILTARSDIDHPICVECTDMLVDGLQRKLDGATRTRDAYMAHLKDLSATQPSDADQRAARDRQRRAEAERAAAMDELRRLEADKDALDEEIVALDEEARQLDRDEAVFWAEHNAFGAKMADFGAERDSVAGKYGHDSQLLQKLQRTNVYNDTFCISHDGSYGTINGLRLGRLSSKPVDWPEINAALGHTLLLLVIVADKLAFRFQGYEPQPLGSTSKIIRLSPSFASASASASASSASASAPSSSSSPPSSSKKTVLELYTSGGVGMRLLPGRFDAAMVALLQLVRQLGDHVRRQTEAAGHPRHMPYPIDADRINNVSIKLGIAQDDGWTKACKFTLTCCKFLLAHASDVSTTSRDAEN